jgi:hypothetical protein
MALQLRRGTNAERATETFAAGELVYTTDTKQLYIGDGSTVGGILVSNSVASSPANLTQNLNLNGFNISGTGNITATAFVGDGSGLTNLPDTGGSGTGVIEGQEYAIDIQGSVRGDDTTLIVDSALGRVSADLYGDGSNITNITLDQLSDVDTTGIFTNAILKWDGAAWAIANDETGGGGGGSGILEGQTYDISITGDVVADDSSIIVDTFNKTFRGSLDGELRGSVFAESSTLLVDAINSVIVGDVDSPSVTAELITVEDQTNPQIDVKKSSTGDMSSYTGLLGEILFKTRGSDGDKSYGIIQGYTSGIIIGTNDNGVNFPAETLNTIGKTGVALGGINPAARLDVRGNAIILEEVKIGSFTTAERDALTAANGMLLYNADTNEFQAYENGGWTAMISDLGNITFAGSVIDTSDSSGITVTPAVTLSSDLTVENNLTVTGSVTADKFISTGTETPEISASANLNLTAGNAVVVTSSPLRMASFTTTERNALAAQNGDIIYNTTDNKFQGYENGAWANLI